MAEQLNQKTPVETSTQSDTRVGDAGGRHSFAASTVTAVDAAGIRVLLVPIGPVRQRKLEEWTGAIAQYSHVELSEILTHVDPELVAAGYSNSSAGGSGGVGVEGAMHFVYTMGIDEDHEYLEGLQTYRQTLGVIGIVDCKSNDDVVEAYEEFLQYVSQFPSVVAYRCLALDPAIDQEDDIPGLTLIPNGGGSLSFYLQTLLTDFAGTMVSALSLMAKSIEDRADLLSPTEPSSVQSVSVASLSDQELPAANIQGRYSSNRSSMQETSESAATAMAHRVSIASPGEQRRESTHSLPTNKGRRGGELDRDAVVPSSPISAMFERKAPKTSDASGSGRLKKLQGDLFLMSGRLAEAFSAYASSIEASRAAGDHLWHAVAVEGYCAALLLLCDRPRERRLVAAFIAGIPDSGSPTQGNISPQSADLGELLSSIGKLFAQVPVIYERCFTFTPLLHAEACVRAALVLHATREALFDDPESSLSALIGMQDLGSVPSAGCEAEIRDVVANTKNIPLRSVINEWMQRGWASSFASLAFADQLEMSAEIGALFRSIGYSRKAFFFLRQFLLLAIPVLLRTATAQRNAGAPISVTSPGARPSMSSRTDHTALSAFSDGASAFAAVSSAAAAAVSASNIAMYSPPTSPSHKRRSFGMEPGHGESPALLAREWFSKPRASLRHAIVACLDALVYSFGLGSTHLDGGGWMHLQADVLRECLAISEALPSYPHAIAAAFRLVRCLTYLSGIVPEPQRRPLFDEQHMLRAYLLRTIGLFHQRYHFDPKWSLSQQGTQSSATDLAAEKRGQRVVGRDAAVLGGVLDSLLVGIQFCTFPSNPRPIPVVSKTNGAKGTGSVSLFLHNPSAQTEGDAPPVLVACEEAHFVVTLQNPFPFSLPLTDLSLLGEIATPSEKSSVDTSGVAGDLDDKFDLASQSVHCTITPGSSAQVLIVATPRVSGQLRVFGLKLTLFQHLVVQCLLAEEAEGDATRRLKELPIKQRLEAERNNLLGLDKPLPDSPAVRLSTMNTGHSLHTHIVPSLPRLTIIESSLAFEESLSVYEGESRVISLTLVNSSESAAVDLLEVAFEPLTSSDGSKRSDELRSDAPTRDLISAAFTYIRPAPSTANDSGAIVEPCGKLCLKIRVSGLSGLSGGEIVVRYRSNAVASSWSRELRWPLRVSVVRFIAPAQESKTGATANSDLGVKYIDLPTYISRAVAGNSNVQIASSSRELVAILREAYAEHSEDFDKGDDEPQQQQQQKPQVHDLFYLAEINMVNLGATDVELTVETDLSTAASDIADALSLVESRKPGFVKSFVVKMPGRRSLSRIVVPLPRVLLSNKLLRSAIPGLEADGGPDRSVFYPWQRLLSEPADATKDWVSGVDDRENKRQFVLSKTGGMSDQELEDLREIHWYKQDICSRVRMRWVCHQSGRSGYIDPRPLFTLNRYNLAAVRPKRLGLQVLIDKNPVCRIDTCLVRAQCTSGNSYEIDFRLFNNFESDLELEISAWSVKDAEDPASDSLLITTRPHAFDGIDASIAAKEYLSEIRSQTEMFVPFSGAGQSASKSDGSFSFPPSTAHKPTPRSSSASDSQTRALDALPSLECYGDIVFDDICDLKLPRIAAGTSHTVSLPLFVLSPGIYKIEYMICSRSRSESAAVEALIHETIVIDSNQ
ncbi:hypothetical protein FB645_004936 [Coemansia sp. IMI 203386]|nr:hypothetical protein FB645_004936 [Coemansia sp. IMI 203386]